MSDLDVMPHGSLETLSEDECVALLAGQTVGRLAVALPNAAPLVVPVNFVLDGRAIVFGTGYGSKLLGAVGRPASFEVDSLDHVNRTGWSVLARGQAHEVREREVRHLDVEPWAPTGRLHWVRLDIGRISGRRIHRSMP